MTERWRSMTLPPPPRRQTRRASRLSRYQRANPPIRRKRIPRIPCKRTRTTQSNTKSLIRFTFSLLPFVSTLVGPFSHQLTSCELKDITVSLRGCALLSFFFL